MNNTKIHITISYHDGDKQTAMFHDTREVPPNASVPQNIATWTQTLTGLEATLSKIHKKLFPNGDDAATPPIKNENTD